MNGDARNFVTISNSAGVHARPAVQITKLAKSFGADIRLGIGHDPASTDAKSLSAVMKLKGRTGDMLVVEATGPDASPAVEAIVQLVRAKFGED